MKNNLFKKKTLSGVSTPLFFLALFFGGFSFDSIPLTPINDAPRRDKGSSILSLEEADAIGRQIWINECRGTLEGLASWNDGEEFASLGIGHFIWYPVGKSGPFKETFPDLLLLFRERGVKLPEWLQWSSEGSPPGCPWTSSTHLAKEFSTPKMEELRQLLAATVPHQVAFIVKRVEQFVSVRFSEETTSDKGLKDKFNILMRSPGGIYAVIDYIHFKGEGSAPQENYRGVGWGFIQVLEAMPKEITSENAVEEFVRAAKQVLYERVQNAPKERGEERWLKGWYSRVDTYITTEKKRQ